MSEDLDAILTGATREADPPATLTLRWCPDCGRTDRITTLGRTRHSHGGSVCEGVPVDLTYVLAPYAKEADALRARLGLA